MSNVVIDGSILNTPMGDDLKDFMHSAPNFESAWRTVQRHVIRDNDTLVFDDGHAVTGKELQKSLTLLDRLLKEQFPEEYL